MKPRDIVLGQIHHRETSPLPFTLGFEQGVDTRLDQHCGTGSWREWRPPYIVNVLYEAVHKAGKITLSHCSGNVADIIPDIIEIGLDVLQSIQPEAMDPYELKAKWGDKITFWGGLGSQSVIPFGTRETIFEEVSRLCDVMPRGGGYILGPAKALQPETSAESAAAVLEAFLEFSGHRAHA